ncbi:hypothetical protein ACFL1Z_04395 [Thermodesulfobacteriota bacterium]
MKRPKIIPTNDELDTDLIYPIYFNKILWFTRMRLSCHRLIAPLRDLLQNDKPFVLFVMTTIYSVVINGMFNSNITLDFI